MTEPAHDLPSAVLTVAVEMTAEIVAAYVAHNALPPGDLPALIRSVHVALVGLGSSVPGPVAATTLTPAVPVKRSVFDTHLVSLIDGKSYKSLKRHIGVAGYTPASYREAYGLPSDYPMVAPAYGRARSELAKTMGLGQARRPQSATAAA